MDYMTAFECSTYQNLSAAQYGVAQYYLNISKLYNNKTEYSKYMSLYADAMRKSAWWNSKARRLLGAGPFDNWGNSQFYKNTLWEGR